MTVDPFPLIRLWQAVVQQAVQDACYSREDERDAREWIASRNFELVCNITGLSSAEIRRQLDDPDLYDRFRRNLGGRRKADD